MRTALEIATFPSRTRRETERTQFTPFTRRSLGSVPVPITVLSLSLSQIGEVRLEPAASGSHYALPDSEARDLGEDPILPKRIADSSQCFRRVLQA